MSGGRMKWNVLCSWGAHVASLITGFFLMPYVIGVLGDDQYGTWVFINSFTAYTGVLYLGMGETICRYVARYHASGERERLNEVVTLVASIYSGGALVALAGAAILAACIGYLGSWTGDALLEVRLVILVLGLNLAISLVGSAYGGVLMGLRRFDLERIVGVVFDLVRVVLIVTLLHRDWGLLTVACIYTVVALLENVSFCYLAYREIPWLSISRRHWKWSVFKECSSFSVMALLSNLASNLISASSSIVIGFLMGPSAIVPYYIALRLTQFIRQPIDKVALICMPTAGALQAVADRSRLHHLFHKAFGFTLLLISAMWIGAYYFGGDLVQLWVGDQYQASHRLLCLLLATTVVALPCNVLRAFLLAQGEIRLPTIVIFSEALLNLTLSILLGYWFGHVGVALGSLLPALLLEGGLLLPWGLQSLSIRPVQVLLRSVRPQLLPLAALWVYCHVVTTQPWAHGSWTSLVAVSAGGGMVLGSVWWIINCSAEWWQSRQTHSALATPSA